MLSFIIPLYNEKARLPACMTRLVNWITVGAIHAEIVLVDNASTDNTLELARGYQRKYERLVRVLTTPTRGKGLAVKTGIMAASGKWLYVCDVDLATPLYEMPRFIEQIKKHDVVIGVRQYDESFARKITHSAFAMIAGLLTGYTDTQCGFKMFRAEAARAIFSNVMLEGFAFDVEALYVANQLGFSVAELPVAWVNGPESRVDLARDSMAMLWDVMNIPFIHKRESGQKSSVGHQLP